MPETHQLPDGSVATVEHNQAARHATVARHVDGVCVWAQVFTTHEHDRTPEIIDRMRARPENFERPWCTRCGAGAHLTTQHPEGD